MADSNSRSLGPNISTLPMRHHAPITLSTTTRNPLGGRGHCKISHVVFWRRMELCASTRTRKCWSLVPPGGIGRRSLTLFNSLHQCPSRTTMFYLSPWTFPRRSTRSITVGHTDAENGGLGLPWQICNRIVNYFEHWGHVSKIHDIISAIIVCINAIIIQGSVLAPRFAIIRRNAGEVLAKFFDENMQTIRIYWCVRVISTLYLRRLPGHRTKWHWTKWYGQNGTGKMVSISIDSNSTELNLYSVITSHK